MLPKRLFQTLFQASWLPNCQSSQLELNVKKAKISILGFLGCRRLSDCFKFYFIRKTRNHSTGLLVRVSVVLAKFFDSLFFLKIASLSLSFVIF